MEILFLIVGLALGVVIAFLFFKGKQNSGADTSLLDSKINELDKQNAVLKTQIDAASNENQKIVLEFRLEKERLMLDNIYAKKNSFFSDIMLIIRTIPAIFQKADV